MGVPKTTDGKPYVSIWPTEGSRTTSMTHNWCDKTTWYTTAVREVNRDCTNQGDSLSYAMPHTWIVDSYHGKLSGEDYIKDANGFSYRVSATVNGMPKTERDPHYGSGGDFEVNYETGTITFFVANNPGDTVQATYHRVVDSVWRLRPKAGTVLKISRVEAQFSSDIVLTDSVVFQPKGLASVFAPQLGLPEGTLIPLGNPTKYKTMMDFINEANGAYPLIPASGGPGWRGLPQGVITYPWDYAALTAVPASLGMEIEVKLEHDTPFTGAVSTAAFYCLSEPE